MTKNPFINALGAATYIAIVASVMFFSGPDSKQPSVFIPIAFISLFTLSAAVMGYLFVYQPLRLYIDGEKNKAVKLFLSTIAVFACITLIFLIVLYSINKN